MFESIGINPDIVTIVLAVLVIVLLVLQIVSMVKSRKDREKYNRFMQGADGATLENAILSRFAELDQLHGDERSDRTDIDSLTKGQTFCYQKFSIVKYDAFAEMGGKLSFSLCMLTDNNDGFILTSVHNSSEGCYTYIKEIIKGEPYVVLGENEKKALAQAKNRKTCLDDEEM